ncbi:putative phylloplanin [Helianthus anomalus]
MPWATHVLQWPGQRVAILTLRASPKRGEFYATVQLSCGGGNVIASTTTNESGGFSFLARLQAILTTVLASCKVDVVTPLSACNATLPTTIPSLEAPLRLVGITLNGTLLITGPFNVMGIL